MKLTLSETLKTGFLASGPYDTHAIRTQQCKQHSLHNTAPKQCTLQKVSEYGLSEEMSQSRNHLILSTRDLKDLTLYYVVFVTDKVTKKQVSVT